MFDSVQNMFIHNVAFTSIEALFYSLEFIIKVVVIQVYDLCYTIVIEFFDDISELLADYEI
jgi:hypothetical protein